MAASAAFSPKRTKRFEFVMSEKLYAELEECGRLEDRSMSEIVHLGAEIIVRKLQKKHEKKEK